MMKKPWFGPKQVGWGWTPISWEGWLATALCVVAVIAAGHILGKSPAAFYVCAAIIAVFVGVCVVTSN
jgi:hypothetical protein